MLTLPPCSLKWIRYIQRFTSRYIFNHHVAPMLYSHEKVEHFPKREILRDKLG